MSHKELLIRTRQREHSVVAFLKKHRLIEDIITRARGGKGQERDGGVEKASGTRDGVSREEYSSRALSRPLMSRWRWFNTTKERRGKEGSSQGRLLSTTHHTPKGTLLGS